MNNPVSEAKKLKELLLQEGEVVEYLRLKELFEADDQLKAMREEIARLSQNEDKNEYNRLKSIYDSHPLVVSYYQAKEDVIKLLNEINEIIK